VREKPTPEGEAKPVRAGKPAEEEGVYLFDEAAKTVSFQPVATGMTGETMVEITTGLEVGKSIVTGPFKTLREIGDGDKVRLEEPKKDDKKK
jgi:multidrug efflux pump subunit AcrA (membrane-fusion protein)